mgnify:CR=1 FL=1
MKLIPGEGLKRTPVERHVTGVETPRMKLIPGEGLKPIEVQRVRQMLPPPRMKLIPGEGLKPYGGRSRIRHPRAPE